MTGDTPNKKSDDGKLFGRYRIADIIGRGGYSTVYRAELQGGFGFRKAVALKVMRRRLESADEPVSQDFLNEARLGGSVQHPHLVEFYECGRVGDRLYIAMELVKGPSLAEVVRITPNLGLEIEDDVVLALAMQIARGLAALHDARVDGKRILAIHRDLKPGNVLLSPAGHAKITDYGVARYATDTYETLGGDGPRGSPLYMSPEQARGEHLTQGSDVFSLGTTVLELINGRPVFGATTIEGVVRKVHRADVADALIESRSRFPQLVPVLENCLLADPALRYRDGAAVIEGLKDIEPPAFAEELIASLAAEVYRAIEFQRAALRRKPTQQFWSNLSDDDEDSVSVSLQTSDSDDDGAVTAPPPAQPIGPASELATADGPEELGPQDAESSEVVRRPLWPLALAVGVVALFVVLLLVPHGIRTLRGGASPEGEPPPGDAQAQAGGPARVTPAHDDPADPLRELAMPPVPETDQTPGDPQDLLVAPEPATPGGPAEPGDALVQDTPTLSAQPADPVALELSPVKRGIRGQATPITFAVTPAAVHTATVWYRAAPSGAWQTRTVHSDAAGQVATTIPAGDWLPQDSRDVDWFVEVASPDGPVRSGSAVRPHRLTLY
jgi:serine/threonine protein kinase